ncbi:MAG TPA: MFS transporter [Terriglobales bacterium]|nr:MFS transporter [Terriglobales bacterium]
MADPRQPSVVRGASTTAEDASARAPAAFGRYRWRICALLFFATTINYVDRQVLGILAPELQRSIGWNEAQYGHIVTAFQAAYALGLLLAGSFIDRVGTRLGYALAVAVWSLSAMGHALARSVLGFGFARFMLGLGESGNFPAAIKTVAEWFPRKERALATGIFNAGSNVGAIIAPLVVPPITVRFGWRAAFLCTGIFSALWIVAWLTTYRRPQEHTGIGRAELRYIESDAGPPAVRVPWAQLLPRRQTWAVAMGKFMTDPVWWFFLFWLPKFLNAKHGLTLTQLGPPLVIIYVMADVGSIAGGWLSSRFIQRGWSVNRARKVTMLICALAVAPIMLAARVTSLWEAVALISLATAAHQGWSANLYTLASDMFPRAAVASVVGIGGFGGAVGGMLIATFAGSELQATGSYLPMFVLAGMTYLAALLMIQLLAPRLEAVNLE